MSVPSVSVAAQSSATSVALLSYLRARRSDPETSGTFIYGVCRSYNWRARSIAKLLLRRRLRRNLPPASENKSWLTLPATSHIYSTHFTLLQPHKCLDTSSSLPAEKTIARLATTSSQPKEPQRDWRATADMATVADELLNDFEDSGSEGEEEVDQNEFNEDGVSSIPAANGLDKPSDPSEKQGGMELDDDEEDIDDDDMEGAVQGTAQEAEDEEEAKERVEKMQLGGVSDVRSVASLMKTLDPILEVSTLHEYTPFHVNMIHILEQ